MYLVSLIVSLWISFLCVCVSWWGGGGLGLVLRDWQIPISEKVKLRTPKETTIFQNHSGQERSNEKYDLWERFLEYCREVLTFVHYI